MPAEAFDPSARMTPGCPSEIRPENFLFGLVLFVPDQGDPQLGLASRGNV